MEQHGPQLPLATDTIFAERVADAVVAEGMSGDDGALADEEIERTI
jgi:creatinine amidohydrolase/Fe(II)-dependent formamide hydrolase-like protein